MPSNTEKNVRPPVVVVMGHVDHGKTTLLDYIRKTNIADREAGGITQAVGAYEIEHEGKKITFIDTPGHEAFTKMRSRGANIADIAILIVAADDGVNAQTKEVIELLKEAEMPFVVAINKIDKNNADIEKTKADLSTNGVYLEGFGGDVSFQPISAKTGDGVPDLLELILLLAEVEGFTYDPSLPVDAYILEARKDPRKGIVATAIIKNGTLHFGDPITTESTDGKVKSLADFQKKGVPSLTASSPAIITGFNDLPKAGEHLVSKDATPNTSGDAEETQTIDRRSKKIAFIVKADVAGSLEALTDAITKLTPPEEKAVITVVESGVGDITDGDINHALTTGAYVVGLNVKMTPPAAALLADRDVTIFESKIIYEILEKIEEAFYGTKQTIVAGDLEILAVFNAENLDAQVIGGRVVEGSILNQASLDVYRGEKKIDTGSIINLQQNKEDAKEVAEGNECGLLFKCETEIKKGDHLIMRPE